MKFNSQQKRWMCLMLSIMILLFGMCFEKIKVDSSVWCLASTGNSSRTITTGSFVTRIAGNEQSLCTTQLLGIHELNVYGGGIPHLDHKACMIMHLLLMFLAVLPLNLIYLLKWLNQLMDPAMEQSYFIINYIHHQDGAKS